MKSSARTKISANDFAGLEADESLIIEADVDDDDDDDEADLCCQAEAAGLTGSGAVDNVDTDDLSGPPPCLRW